MELTSPSDFAKDEIQTVQSYVLFCAQSIANLFRKPVYFGDMVLQGDLIGVGSLPIVALTGFFTGAVLALQAANTLERFGPSRWSANWSLFRWCANLARSSPG